ncbi:MAG: ATP-binding protein [Candidatus Parcubacteria bacterium]|nr:ATP-binding protein [Candidatus Paceibacterota bacterium]
MQKIINQDRIIQDELLKPTDKVLVLLGPRQIGKTTLLKNSFPDSTYINIEKSDYIDVLNSRDTNKIKELFDSLDKSQTKSIILDEVQRLKDPGLVAKVIYDELKEYKLIISGSSALEIANTASESLAGRKKTILMYPLSYRELQIQTNQLEPSINQIMLYGLYPGQINISSPSQKEEYLIELVDSIILKDIYYLNIVKNTKNLIAVLKLLAYQVGQLVNYSEIADRIGISRITVVDYIEILKKSYIIFTLAPYTNKRRDEIGKTEKVYFYDLGVRNALINDFSPVEYRKDYGNLFENFVIAEVMKANYYNKLRYNLNFWRTKWGSEVDLVLTKDGQHKAIEIKTRKGKITKTFKDTYENTEEEIVTVDKFKEFISRLSTINII